MRTVEKRLVTYDREYTTSVTCDRCGGTVNGGEVRMSAGYGSIYDLDSHEFDICDDCWPELFRWFRKAHNTESEPS